MKVKSNAPKISLSVMLFADLVIYGQLGLVL